MVVAAGGSVVVRRQLGRELRRLRLRAGKDVADVTAAGLGSKAKMSRIEGGKGPVRVADVRALCWLYGADIDTTEALAVLAPGTQSEDWWESVVPEWFSLYTGLEATAHTIRAFEPGLVHGLVQTADYARAVFVADARLSADLVEQRVRLRLERQRTAAHVAVIMSEAALLTLVGSEQVMAEQVAHLRSAGSVRVLPFTAGPPPRDTAFALLEFTDDDDPAVVFVEGGGVARYLDKAEDWAAYERSWADLMDRSISITEWGKR